MLIIKTIIIDLTIIFLIFSVFLVLGYFIRESTEEVKEIPKEETKKFYLQLINTSTEEILSFKNKKEFIDTIEGFDTIKYFLKGTEEQNTNQLIKWYYPEYKKL